jgi:hypothetical protein
MSMNDWGGKLAELTGLTGRLEKLERQMTELNGSFLAAQVKTDRSILKRSNASRGV